jgi:Zn-dependent alcohol dehydrogenase
MQAIAQSLQYASVQNIVAITPGATSGTLSGVGNYSLYLTASASVEMTTAGGQTVTMTLPAGYNPIRVANVTSVSTGTAYAMY